MTIEIGIIHRKKNVRKKIEKQYILRHNKEVKIHKLHLID